MIPDDHPFIDRQRRRFMRPDAHRYLKPDAQKWLRPGLPDVTRLDARAAASQTADADTAITDDDIAAYRRALLQVRRELAGLRVLLRSRKAGFDPNQPRVPAGNPDGGQWTDTPSGINDPRILSDVAPDNDWVPGAQYAAARDRAAGHHYVNQSLYEKLPLSPETRKVFQNAKTGRLYHPRSNRYDHSHRLYNDAVRELFAQFLDENSIRPEQMTPAQARRFVDDVLRSADPRIRVHNMRIWMREIMIRVPRGLRGNE